MNKKIESMTMKELSEIIESEGSAMKELIIEIENYMIKYAESGFIRNGLGQEFSFRMKDGELQLIAKLDTENGTIERFINLPIEDQIIHAHVIKPLIEQIKSNMIKKAFKIKEINASLKMALPIKEDE